MSSVVSLRAFADQATLPVTVLLDMQRQHPAKPQLLAICGIDSALGDCAQTPLIDPSRANRRATGRNETSVGQARNEVATAIVSGVSAWVVETAAWIATTAPRSPRNRKRADG